MVIFASNYPNFSFRTKVAYLSSIGGIFFESPGLQGRAWRDFKTPLISWRAAPFSGWSGGTGGPTGNP